MNKFLLFLVQMSVCMLGTFLVVFIWIPKEETYVVSFDPTVQYDGVHGYTVMYYSRIQIPLYLQNSFIRPIPPFATRTVAMMGHKKLGFTPIRGGDVGRTQINWSGFVILWVLSIFIFYITHYFCEFFTKQITKYCNYS